MAWTAPRVPEIPLLFENTHYLAANKPAGLPTHATVDPRRPHLHGLLLQQLTARGATAPYLGVHHRLDRDTTGVLIFAKTPQANAALAEVFAGRALEKVYWAILEGSLPEATGELRDYLSTERTPQGEKAIAVRSGGKPACTRYRVVRPLPGGRCLVELEILTGRMHQIRCQCALRGAPVAGDSLYGKAPPRAPRTLLHAARLRFTDPISGEPLCIEAPMPADMRLD